MINDASSDIDVSNTLRDNFESYLKNYKWFIISALFALIISFFYLRKQIPEYKIDASILISDAEKGNSINELTAFENLGLFGSNNSSVENEIQILKSRRLLTKVVEELMLNTSYFIKSSPTDIELYSNSPVFLNRKVDSTPPIGFSSEVTIRILSKSHFEIFDYEANSMGKKEFGKEFQMVFSNGERNKRKSISLELDEGVQEEVFGKDILIRIEPINRVVDRYMNGLIIEIINQKMSNVIKLSLTESNIEKGIAIINNLIAQYNADGIYDKSLVAQTTIDFLDLRLGLISTELEAIESSAEQFKTKNRMVDQGGADVFLQSSAANERELVFENTQLELANFMIDELNSIDEGLLLPGNIGISDESILSMINDYNTLVLQRNRVMKSSSTKNPIVVNIDSQLVILRDNLSTSLKTLISTLEIQINALAKRSGSINSKIASIPKNEREFKDIVRQQETKNTLYLFLLQKREESILSNAIHLNKAKIIDYAYSNGLPISPKKKLTYLAALFAGFLIPIVIIYLKSVLDTKVHTERDLRTINAPYIGDIPLSSSKDGILIRGKDDSKVAEAFRYIRTNINFMLSNDNSCKTIMITSTLSSEGKTVTAINLASSLAFTGKKTLLLGMDLRAPKLSNYLGRDQINGVTNFIKNDQLEIEDLVIKSSISENLFILESGDIPPNPVELLMNTRVDKLFKELKQKFDYIIVDTAPVGLVTDAIEIGPQSDLTLFVVRSNFLDKRMLHIGDKLFKQNKLPNMAILLNGSDHSNTSYGYGYGYGKTEVKPWRKFFMNFGKINIRN